MNKPDETEIVRPLINLVELGVNANIAMDHARARGDNAMADRWQKIIKKIEEAAFAAQDEITKSANS